MSSKKTRRDPGLPGLPSPRIKALSPDQAADLPLHREHWRAIGLSTAPADFERAKKAIGWIYTERLNKPMPMFLCFSSPMMCVLAIAAIKQLAKRARKGPLSKLDLSSQLSSQLDSQLSSQLDSQLYSQLDSQLYSQLSSQLDSQLSSQLYSQLSSQLYSQLSSQLSSQLYSQLDSQLDSQLYSQLDSQLSSQLSSQLDSQLSSQLDSQLYSQLYSQLDSQLDSQLYSQLDSQLDSPELRDAFGLFRRYWLMSGQTTASWIAFHTFAAKIGVTYESELWRYFETWATLGEACSWWMAFDGLCIISDRPRRLTFDAERRLHGEARAAIAFSDGWGVHAWHGTRVPADWIDRRETLKPEQVLACPNLEQRRAGIEILGWDRILSTLPSRLIDADPDPLVGTLIEIDLPGIEDAEVIKALFLRAQCGTGRQFALGIDPAAGAKTALEAQAWLQGLSPNDFAIPQVRT